MFPAINERGLLFSFWMHGNYVYTVLSVAKGEGVGGVGCDLRRKVKKNGIDKKY